MGPETEARRRVGEDAVYAEERRLLLVQRARADGRVDVAALSEELAVAPETIRRDLNDLEAHGLLRRVHGGAIPVERLGFETDLSGRAVAMRAEKTRIARAAAARLGDAESVFIDEGSTAQILVDQLPPDRSLTVVTSALPTGVALAGRSNVDLLVLGGRVRGQTLGAVDHWATRMLADLVLDLAFLGANGVTVQHGLTTPDPAVAAVKAAAVAASRRRILIADHTKFGINAFCRFAGVRDLEAIITDEGLPTAQADALRAAGPELVLS